MLFHKSQVNAPGAQAYSRGLSSFKLKNRAHPCLVLSYSHCKFDLNEHWSLLRSQFCFLRVESISVAWAVGILKGASAGFSVALTPQPLLILRGLCFCLGLLCSKYLNCSCCGKGKENNLYFYLTGEVDTIVRTIL